MTFFDQNISPIKQAAIILSGSMLFMVGAFALTKFNILDVNKLFPWEIATGASLLFGIFNSVMSLNTKNFAKYWGASVYSYMALALVNGMAAWGFSGVALRDAESFKFIYLVVTFGFLFFISMVNIMRKIVDFAQKEEWNSPNIRKNGK
jgi:hypothetical protein